MRYFGKIKSEKRRASGSKTRNPQSPDGVIRQKPTAFYGKTGEQNPTKPDGVLRQNRRTENDKTRRLKTTIFGGGIRQKITAKNDKKLLHKIDKKLLQKIDKKLRHNPTFFAADSDKISPAYSDKNRDMRGCFIVNFQRIKVRYQPTCRRPRLFLRSKKR